MYFFNIVRHHIIFIFNTKWPISRFFWWSVAKKFESLSEVWLFWSPSHWNACAHFKLEHSWDVKDSGMWASKRTLFLNGHQCTILLNFHFDTLHFKRICNHFNNCHFVLSLHMIVACWFNRVLLASFILSNKLSRIIDVFVGHTMLHYYMNARLKIPIAYYLMNGFCDSLLGLEGA